jgi:hypothetical protein
VRGSGGLVFAIGCYRTKYCVPMEYTEGGGWQPAAQDGILPHSGKP